MSYGSNHCCINYSDEFHDLNNKVPSLPSMFFDGGAYTDLGDSSILGKSWYPISGVWLASSGTLVGSGNQAFIRCGRTFNLSLLSAGGAHQNNVIYNGYGSGLINTCFEENPQKWQKKVGLPYLPLNSFITFQAKSSGLYEYPYDSVSEAYYRGLGAEITVKNGVGGLIWGTGGEWIIDGNGILTTGSKTIFITGASGTFTNKNYPIIEEPDLTKRGATLLLLNNNKLALYDIGPDSEIIFANRLLCASGFPFYKIREVQVPASGKNKISLRTNFQYFHGFINTVIYSCYYDDDLLMTIIGPNGGVLEGGITDLTAVSGVTYAWDGWGVYASGITKFSSYKQFYTIPDYSVRAFVWPSASYLNNDYPANYIGGPIVYSGQVDQIVNTQSSGSFINNFTSSGNPTDLIFPNLRACKPHRNIFWPDTDFFPETCVVNMNITTNDPYISTCGGGTKTSSLSYRSDAENTLDLDDTNATDAYTAPSMQLFGASYGDGTQNFSARVIPRSFPDGLDITRPNHQPCYGVSLTVNLNSGIWPCCSGNQLPNDWIYGSGIGDYPFFPYCPGGFGAGRDAFGYSIEYARESNLLGPFNFSGVFQYTLIELVDRLDPSSFIRHQYQTEYLFNVQFM